VRPASPDLGVLLERIADREAAALVHLHALMAGSILDLVGAEIGDTAAAPAITRAVFLEVWWLAPVTPPGDAGSWLTAIAARRSAEHRRTPPGWLGPVYDRHVARELAAVLAAGSAPPG
jgi:acyl dehydratase